MQRIAVKALILFVMAAVIPVMSAVLGISADTVKLMNKGELKGLLGSSDVVILDVRRGRDWSSSEFKIKGAKRAAPQDFEQWEDRYPKDKTLVLYCA